MQSLLTRNELAALACTSARVVSAVCSVFERQAGLELELGDGVPRQRELHAGWVDADPGNDVDEPYIWEY
jgi:hypothetical protein